jgi:PAS domain S-box-containing protein
MNAPIRILLVDDSPYFLDAARDFLQHQDTLTVVGAAASGEEAIAQSLALRPDVILLDLNLGQRSGLDLIPIFRELLPATRIIVLTMMEEDSYRAATLQAGADRFVHKSAMSKTLVDAILETVQHTRSTKTTAQGPNAAVHAKQAGDYLQRLAEHLPDLIYRYEVAPTRGFTYVSPSAAAMTGYTPEEHYTDPGLGFRLIHPDDLHILEQIAQGDFSTQQLLELRWIRKDGTLLWVEQRNVNIFNEAGELVAIEGVARDITERKRAEATLCLQGEALEAAASAIVITDVNGAIQWVNSAFTRLTGYSSVEVVGKNPCILSSGKHDAAFYKGLWDTILAGKSWHGELINRRKDGSLYDEEQTITPIAAHSAKITHFIGIKQDITSRKQTAAKIWQQLERLAALHKIDQTIASNLDLHVSLNVLLAQAVELLAADAAVVLLLNAPANTLEFAAGIGFWTDTVQSASVPFGESHAGKAALERRRVQIPNLADEPDNFLLTNTLKGESFVSYHGAPLIVENRVVGVLEVFNRSVVERDVEWFDFLDTLAGQAAIAVESARLYSAAQHELTERTRAEAKLRVLNKELEERVEERTSDLKRLNLELERALHIKDEFLANMSHELRTPLNAVIGLSEILAEQVAGPLNEKQQKYVGIINENGSHLLELINDILDIAKSEAGQITLDYADVDIGALCQASVRMLAELALKKQQSITFDVDESIGHVWADQRRLKQMLVNLLSNAVKFTPENGKIGLEVRGNQDTNTISFTVWDTGIGIREEDLPQLFRPFVQLSSDMAHKTTGTGLGLALVSKMARLYDGHVSVESEPDKGSRFTITLPWRAPLATAAASKITATTASSAVDPATTLGTQTILLVEDTESNALSNRAKTDGGES